MKRITFLFVLLFAQFFNAQEGINDLQSNLVGNWEGAFIKGNSYQKFNIQFIPQDSTIVSLQILEEWHPQFGEFQLPVAIDSTGLITFNTGYGKAQARLDMKSLELNGYIMDSNPTVYIHFKKIPLPPPTEYSVQPLQVSNGEIEISGHLHKPRFAPSKTAIIIVGGRGCYAGSTKYDLYAKLFRSYGIATVAYNKRGTGNTSGNCNNATIADLASDVVAIRQHLKETGEFNHIGVLGSSAGAWVMLKASEDTAFDFYISVSGPSTSVLEQQMQSLDEGIRFYNLSDKARADATRYTELVFEARANEKNYSDFRNLLEAAETDDWKKLLDPTDIPDGVEGIDNLWVRRHNYDPSKAFKAIEVPYLALYGAADWIVPPAENIARIKSLFPGSRSKLLTTKLLPEAEHGTEVKEGYQKLPGGGTYWRFFRISPHVQIEIVDFLQKNEFIAE